MKRQAKLLLLTNHIFENKLVFRIHKINSQKSKVKRKITPILKCVKDMNKFFSKEDIQVANKQIQHYSSSGKYKLKPQGNITTYFSKIVKMKNSDNIKCCQEFREIRSAWFVIIPKWKLPKYLLNKLWDNYTMEYYSAVENNIYKLIGPTVWTNNQGIMVGGGKS